MSAELLAGFLRDAGYRVAPLDDGQRLLAESEKRVIWCRSFVTASELIDGWQNEQAHALERTVTLSTQKAWELYLLLSFDVPADPEQDPALDAIRSDTAYARKLLVPGLEGLSPAAVSDFIAPLLPLRIEPPSAPPSAVDLLEEAAKLAGEDEVLTVLNAFRDNKPLFSDL